MLNINKVDKGHNGHHPIKSIAWDKICRPKCKSGLRIRKIEDLNVVYLAKQG